MRDVELVLRYFAYRNFVPNYNGELKSFLDTATLFFNREWEESSEMIKAQATQFEKALSATRTIFGDRDEIRKWNGEIYEKPINRAVFDIMMYYLSFDHIRDAALKDGPAVKKAFQHECEHNRSFLSALEATTKSIEANRTRFSVWAGVLKGITGLNIESPLK